MSFVFRTAALGLKETQCLPGYRRVLDQHAFKSPQGVLLSLASHRRWQLSHMSTVSSQTHRTPQRAVVRSLSSRILYAAHRSRILRPLPAVTKLENSNTRPNLDPDGPPRQVVFWGILALNGVVYLAWQQAYSDYVRDFYRRLQSRCLTCTQRQNRDPTLHRWLTENFTVSMTNFREGRMYVRVHKYFFRYANLDDLSQMDAVDSLLLP